MFKTILIPAGGGASDDAVFATALALGRPFGSHLEFDHIYIGPAEAAMTVPHGDFVLGPATQEMLHGLRKLADERAAAARKHFQEFCAREQITIADQPSVGGDVSASWIEEKDSPCERLLLRARRRDVVVIGRSHGISGMPSDLLELFVVGAGRPIVVASDTAPESFDTVMVCWKETPESARALASAMPLLVNAKHVVVIAVAETESTPPALGDLVNELAWHSIMADVKVMTAHRKPVAEQLFTAAKETAADLIVLGAYGHSRTRELIFGGVTQAMLADSPVPVFMLH